MESGAEIAANITLHNGTQSEHGMQIPTSAEFIVDHFRRIQVARLPVFLINHKDARNFAYVVQTRQSALDILVRLISLLAANKQMQVNSPYGSDTFPSE